jgi:hypothetical protein
MEKLGLLGAATVLFGVGLAMVLYELARNKAGRPILKGSQAVQPYYITYLMMFVLGTTVTISAIVR